MTREEKREVGRHQIIGEIGRGQMGVVYKAQHPTMDRIVALKVVQVEGFPQPDVLRKRLQSEAKLAGGLRHPNIVTIYDAGEEENHSFIVMEYLEGPTLAEFIESGVSSPQQAIDIALQLCDALSYAHERGMIHGDLKPSNIKVLENLKVKITDFGLARSIKASTVRGTFTGTLTYASPEQLRGNQIDGRSDIFSLGVILFEMLAGARPFMDSDLRRNAPVQDRLDSIPSNFLRNVLLRALAPDADQRYQTCAALDHDLKRYQSGDIPMITRNPFIYGPPITEPQYFYGRHQEIQVIVGRLKGITPGSSAIIGGRRIGKTSLLRKLYHPSAIQEYGFTSKYLFIYLYPFITKESQSPGAETQLWQLILRGMLDRMGSQLPADSTLFETIDETLAQVPITFNDFKSVIAETHKARFKIVLLFDEFQHVVGNEAFQPGLFGGLRDLTQSYNLAFVTATGKNLQALAKSKEVAASPFWNVFTNVYLEPFNDKDAYDLVAGYTQKTDISFITEDTDYVLRISGGHPYFLQLACWCVFAAYQEGKWGRDVDQEEAKQNIEEKFFRQAEPHFMHFWEQSSEVEKRTLIILAYRSQKGRTKDHQQEEPTLQLGPGLKALSERGIAIRTGSGTHRVFSPPFTKWIRQHTEDNFGNELEPHFRCFWERAEKDEQRILIMLARREQGRGFAGSTTATKYKRLAAQPKPTLDALMRRGLVIQTDDHHYEIFTPLFRKWILSQQGNVWDRFSLMLKKASHGPKRVMIALAVVLFVLSAILVLPDLPDLTMKMLNIENVTPVQDLRDRAGEELQVRVYSPKLLFVGEDATIKIQTYGAEKPIFEVTVQRGSPDVVITTIGNNAFEIECVGTNANVLSQSEHVELMVKATVPVGASVITPITVKTNNLLSRLVHIGILLASGIVVIGSLNVKDLSEWVQAIKERKRTQNSSEK